MTLTHEDLVAISQIVEEKVAPIDNRLKAVEEKITPIEIQLNTIEDRLTPIEIQLNAIEDRLTPIEIQLNTIEDRLTPMENEMKKIRVDLLENNVIPRLCTIESCYIDTFNRYRAYTDKIETVFHDMEIVKKVVTDHSEKLQKIS